MALPTTWSSSSTIPSTSSGAEYSYDYDDGENKSKAKGSWRYTLTYMFGMDIRSIAFFRMCLAAIVIGDLIDRSRDLYAHYTDAGVIPRLVIAESNFHIYFWPIYMINGTLTFARIMFFIHFLVSFSMLVGFYTKLSTFLNWYLVTSLQERNDIVGHAGDLYLRVMIFWSLFLPTGECWSIDNTFYYKIKRKFSYSGNTWPDPNKPPGSNYVVNAGTVAAMAQISFMYIFSYYHKSGKEWTEWYTATFYALSLDYFRLPLGDFMLHFPGLLKLLTFAVRQWEYWGPFCFALPWKQQYFRLLGVVGFMALHLGFGLCLRLGTFFWIGFLAVTCLLPPFVWDTLGRVAIASWVARRTNHTRKAWSADATLCHVSYSSKRSPYVDAFVKILQTFFCLPGTLHVVDQAAVKPNKAARPASTMATADAAVPAEASEALLDSKKSDDAISLNGGGAAAVANTSSDQVAIEFGYDGTGAGPAVAMATGAAVPSIGGGTVALEVVDYANRRYYDYDAGIALLRASPVLLPIASVLGLRAVKTVVRAIGAAIHFVFFTSPFERAVQMPATQHAVSTRPTHYRAKLAAQRERRRRQMRKVVSWVRNGIAAFLVLYIFSWNLGNIGSEWHTPASLKWIAWVTRLDQAWGMFSPHPPLYNWWHAIEATLHNGTKFDLFKNNGMFNWEGGELNWEKPVPFHLPYKNHRWFKVWEAFNSNNHRLEVGRYICREYNRRRWEQEKKLKGHKIWHLSQLNHPDGSPPDPVQKLLLWDHVC